MNANDVLGGLERRWFCSYCGSTYAEYCNGCPRCHLGEPGTSTSLRVVTMVPGDALPLLLEVVAEARKVIVHTSDFGLETALARLDGEVGNG